MDKAELQKVITFPIANLQDDIRKASQTFRITIETVVQFASTKQLEKSWETVVQFSEHKRDCSAIYEPKIFREESGYWGAIWRAQKQLKESRETAVHKESTENLKLTHKEKIEHLNLVHRSTGY